MMRIACDMLDDLDPAWSELASVGLQLSDRELTQLLAMTSEQHAVC